MIKMCPGSLLSIPFPFPYYCKSWIYTYSHKTSARVIAISLDICAKSGHQPSELKLWPLPNLSALVCGFVFQGL